MYKLVKFAGNYADEFDLEGFRVFEEQKLAKFLEDTKEVFEKLLVKAAVKHQEHWERTMSLIPEEWKLLYQKDTNAARKAHYGFHEVFSRTKEEYVEYRLKFMPPELSCAFGTNEAMTFSSYKSYLNQLKIVDLTEEEYAVLNKLFGSSYSGISFGEFPDIIECYEDTNEVG